MVMLVSPPLSFPIIQVFWNVTLCHWINTSQRLKGSSCPHLHDHAVQDPEHLHMPNIFYPVTGYTTCPL